ncbi:MAG: MarR family transcriptional regulator, lower aerobic nicotinate degradation pathway regulator [Gaiellaceae bacterium]|nr:MarR family transcriptional regulator, lower aerobic nicotinate degradation pathway regulator [Gaiellaceae bacterium]
MSYEPHDARAFARLIADAQRAFALAEREALDPFGITPPVFGLLDVIARNAGISPAGAAEELGVTRPTVTGWLNGLRELGLVARGESDRDGRKARLTLTDDGRTVHQAAVDVIRRKHTRLLASAVDPTQQAGLMDALYRVSQAGKSARAGS